MNIDGDEVSPFKVFGYSETFFVDTEDVEKEVLEATKKTTQTSSPQPMKER